MEQRCRDESQQNAGRTRWLWPLVAVLVALAPVAASAQCVGDCNDDGVVELNEVIVGVGIALDSRELADCRSFDDDRSLSVEVTELLVGVGHSLGDPCPPTPTPTDTSTPTPSATPSPTISELCGNGQMDSGEECDDGRQCDDGTTDCTDDPSVCADIVNGICRTRRGDGCQDDCTLSRCGDGIVDNLIPGDPETCDDGNTIEEFGDVCPANCRVAPCTPSGKRTANVNFDAEDDGAFIVGMQIFVRYPEDRVSIPGSSDDAAVKQAVQSTTFAITPNDVNFGLNAILSGGATEGTAFTIAFDTCEGTDLPSPEDFTCVVDVATDADLNDVTDQVTCSVVFP